MPSRLASVRRTTPPTGLLGHVFSQYKDAVSRLIRKPVVIAVAAVAASGMNIAGFKVLYEPVYAVAIIGAIALAMVLVPKIPAGRGRSALEYVGRNSIIIYILHLLVIKVAGTLLQRIGMENPWVMFPLLVVLGVGVSIAVMMLSDRYRIFAWLFEWNTPARRGHRVAVGA